MRQLRAPGLGPIVGHTTHNTARLWIRAMDPADDGPHLDEDRRSIGVAAIVKRNGQDVDSMPVYFRLRREFDRTGTFVLGADGSLGSRGPTPPLDPDTEYEVALGTLTIDDPFENDETVPDDVLAERLPPLAPLKTDLRNLGAEARASFRTFPDAANGPARRLDFLLGSCRYPGLLWQAKLSDRVFGPMLNHLRPLNDQAARFVLMIGDQIYGDLFNRLLPVGRADTFKEFQSRYLTAFGSRNMRQLLKSAPHYMILDDHEIEDNWTQDRLRKNGKHELFNTAIAAYLSYQWSHGPRTWGKRLHYKFDCAGYPFFVLDSRTQRTKDDVLGSLEDNHLLGRQALAPGEEAQLDHLLKWLVHQHRTARSVPKFIVSPSVFVPNDMSERQGPPGSTDLLDPTDAKAIKRMEASDSWPAYPQTRRAILRTIVDNRIENVVFLSGDVHCSNVATMTFTKAGQPVTVEGGTAPLRAHSITSSAFYWPFPFADGNPSDFVHDSKAAGQEDTFRVTKDVNMDYLAWNFTQDDNYCRIVVDQTNRRIDVHVHGADGAPVLRADGKPMLGQLGLEPW